MNSEKKRDGTPRPDQSAARETENKRAHDKQREEEPLDEKSLERVMRDAPL